ncbi:MAG: alpha/beta fold hydrolase [Deltaproteobacteria bacterium]|nr:alpha/beta fold hydrolase [Deltaproteobacteria bacterium]
MAEALLFPVDRALGAALDVVRERDAFDRVSDASYHAIRTAMRTQFELVNELEVLGDHNVPDQGGVVLASNHQSWLDVQVLGASCPRRVHFVAKSEFRDWPVLRHLIELSQSIFVRRGGDEDALEAIVEALRSGKAVAIYPEGTIPGEEDVPRRAVDPATGLLRGKTGAVRLAIRAGVPIVPVGVSGTGRAFPPEIYPRLEVLRMPGSTPVRIRYGEPWDLSEYHGRELDHHTVRELTDELMRRISALVDHRSNYAPIEVPIPEPQRYDKLAVLLLHGFTSSTDTVDGLIPHLERAGIRYERPILRGHGTRYQDMRGVTARHWYVDADRALLKLWNQGYHVVVVGLSMGGLVALELAMRHPDVVAGAVTVAACLKFKDPLSGLSPVLANLVRYWPSPESFHDPELAKSCTNYPKFATDAFASLYRYSREIADRLHEVHVPIRILQTKADQIVAPESANIIYEKVSSPIRQIVWFDRSGHEMMQDMEADAVFAEVMNFVKQFRARDAAGDSAEA